MSFPECDPVGTIVHPTGKKKDVFAVCSLKGPSYI